MNALKKWWVKLLLVIAAVVLMLAVWLTMLGIHSKNAVERYKDQLRAAGEDLDYTHLIPPRVDPDKNALELLMQAFAIMPSSTGGVFFTHPPVAMKMVAPGKAMVGSQQKEMISDEVTTNTWEDLYQALQLQGPALDILRQASERPQLSFELNYEKGAMMPLPYLAKMKDLTLLLSPAVVADLHRGDTASAATNLQTLLLILNQWSSDPLFISQLIRGAMTPIAVSAQWEFLQATNLTDDQLAMLQRDWANLQLVAPMEKTLLMERAWASLTIQQLRTSNSPSGVFSEISAGWTSYGSGGSPGGLGDTLKDMRDAMKRRTADALWRVSWSYDDELHRMQGDQVLIEAARQIRTNGYFKEALAARDRKIAALGLNHPGTNWLRNELDDVLESMIGGQSVQGNARSLERLMSYEAARTLTVTAIAIKRYELRHRALPKDLNALVPEFLAEVPRDPADGLPLRYQLLPDGTYRLYSIGSDWIDNGGDANAQAGSKSLGWLRARDWVWPQPASAPEVQNFRANPPN